MIIIIHLTSRFHQQQHDNNIMLQNRKFNQQILIKVSFTKKYVVVVFISNLILLDLSDDSGGFLGRTLNQAMSLLRNSNITLDPSTQPLPLQTCLTYLTLPCQSIVKDILESNSVPMLTPQQSK